MIGRRRLASSGGQRPCRSAAALRRAGFVPAGPRAPGGAAAEFFLKAG